MAQVPCQCQIRALQLQERQFAPDPPPDMKGEIAYGYKVDPRQAARIVRKEVGNRKINSTEKYCVLWGKFRVFIPLTFGSEEMDLVARRDIDDYDGKPFHGHFVVIATEDSRLLPSKRRIERLKKLLRTDDEPEWCEVW